MVKRSSFKRKLFRAAMLRCPWCGSRRTFLRGWFHRHDRCRTCGIRWRREEGFELGAVTMNTVITMFVLVVAMAISLVVTIPDVPVGKLIISLSIVAVALPVIIYPFTYTLWLALDLTVHPPDKAELVQADLSVVSTTV
ncbi:MAG: DUF983 domain-containing protein [Ilumatobacteraceae bacterium]